MMNSVQLIGRIGSDVDLKYTPSGNAVAKFRLAIPRPFKKQGGETETDWINIVAWKKVAEYAANYLSKGRLVAVVGRIETRSWDAQDGTKRYATDIVAERLTGLDKPKDGAAPASGEDYGGGEDYDPLAES